MKTYRTRTGSIYDVDGNRVRRRIRSSQSDSERVTSEWQVATVSCLGVGHPLVIVWGFGKDEHSDNPKTLTVGTEDGSNIRMRTTMTSAVEAISDTELIPS